MQAKPRPANRGEALLNVWQHFIVEGHPKAVDEDGECIYRTEDGQNGCAIGCQLPDNFPNLRQLVADNPAVIDDVFTGFQIEEYLNTSTFDLSRLQIIHDVSEDKHQMKQKLEKLALKWGVNLTSR